MSVTCTHISHTRQSSAGFPRKAGLLWRALLWSTRYRFVEESSCYLSHQKLHLWAFVHPIAARASGPWTRVSHATLLDRISSGSVSWFLDWLPTFWLDSIYWKLLSKTHWTYDSTRSSFCAWSSSSAIDSFLRWNGLLEAKWAISTEGMHSCNKKKYCCAVRRSHLQDVYLEQ